MPHQEGDEIEEDIEETIEDAIDREMEKLRRGRRLNDREYQIIVPKFDNSGRKIDTQVIEDIAVRISERFGGVTVFPSVAGCFIPDEGDMAGELMCEENVVMMTTRDSMDDVDPESDEEFIRRLGTEVGHDLGQFSVFVSEDVVEADFVPGEFREELSEEKLGRNVFKKLV